MSARSGKGRRPPEPLWSWWHQTRQMSAAGYAVAQAVPAPTWGGTPWGTGQSRGRSQRVQQRCSREDDELVSVLDQGSQPGWCAGVPPPPVSLVCGIHAVALAVHQGGLLREGGKEGERRGWGVGECAADAAVHAQAAGVVAQGTIWRAAQPWHSKCQWRRHDLSRACKTLFSDALFGPATLCIAGCSA